MLFPPIQANYTKYLYNVDGKSGKEDSRASRAALPRFVDKALQLLNLNQVVGEVETSVMSKMSCTACKAGAGLLQHYIKTGKTSEDIAKITYQFCTSFKLQTPRVCEGITELFSVSRDHGGECAVAKVVIGGNRGAHSLEQHNIERGCIGSNFSTKK